MHLKPWLSSASLSQEHCVRIALKDTTLTDLKGVFSGHKKAAKVDCLGVNVSSEFTREAFLMKPILNVSDEEETRGEQDWFCLRVHSCAPVDCVNKKPL